MTAVNVVILEALFGTMMGAGYATGYARRASLVDAALALTAVWLASVAAFGALGTYNPARHTFDSLGMTVVYTVAFVVGVACVATARKRRGG